MSQNVLTNVTIKVITQAEGALRSFNASLSEVDKGIKKHQESLKAVSQAAVVFGGAIVGGLTLAMRAAQEQVRVEQQLQAVLKSTGGVAGVTAAEVKRLASEYQNVTNFGDEAIIGGQNLLLTFTKIGKDVFPQATETMLDMSVALGQDLNGSAVQLGKALQDPILGVSALRRVGVNFSASQQEVIKKLVETGKAAEAQKYILAELNREFGGSAKAAANPVVQLKNAVDDLAEAVGGALLPSVKKTAADLIPVVQNVGKWLQEHPRLTEAVVKSTFAIGALSLVLGTAGLALGRIVTTVKALYSAVIYAIPAIRSAMVAIAGLSAPLLVAIALTAALAAGFLYMQNKIDTAWKATADSAAANTARITGQYDTWQQASANLTGNEQKYAQIRISMAYHMAEAVRLSEAQIEQYRLGGSEAAIKGFQEQMDFHNKKITEMGQAALDFQKSHKVDMKKVQGAYADVGQSAKNTGDDIDGASKDSQDKLKKMKEAMTDLGKGYRDTEIDINRRLLDLKTKHREAMQSLAKDLQNVDNDITKLKNNYQSSLDDMVAAHNKALGELTETKAGNLVEQFKKVQELQQQISDYQYKPDQLQSDQLVTILANRQDKGNELSARDAKSYNLSSSQVEQVNTLLTYRREQEALVKVLKDNYTISEDLGKSLNTTFGETQLGVIQKIIASLDDLKKAQDFSGMTDIEKSFANTAKQQSESNADFAKQQSDKKKDYDDQLKSLQDRRKEIEENKRKAEQAYTAERKELIKTKIAMQEFSNDYIENLNTVEKVTEDKLKSMQDKLTELRDTISSIDALLQRKASITGGTTITQAAQAAQHADGGVFSSPHLGWVAENGRPEAIIPLKGGSVPVSIKGGGMGRSYVINVNLGGVSMKKETTAQEIAGTIVRAIDNQLLKSR